MKTFLTLAVAIISCCTASAQLLSGKFLTNNFLPAFRSPDTLTNSPVYVVGDTNLGLDAQLILGPGDTNVLYRSEGDLVYTNGNTTAYPGLVVIDGTGGRARYESGGNLAVIRGEAGVSLVDGISTGNELRWFSKYFAPTSITDAKLGGNNQSSLPPFVSVNAKTNIIWGYIDPLVTTNYAGLFISHTGTNGAAVFDSQSAGTAGNPRPITLSYGGTNVFQIDGSDTATHTRMLIFDVDTGLLQRVTVGAADSGGTGFRLLRIPN